MKNFLFTLLFTLNSLIAYSQEADNYSPEKHFRIAEKMFSQNNCQGALNHISKTLASHADDWEAYELRAMIYECLGKIDKAISDYSILIYHYPEHAEHYFSRGELNYRFENYEQAIDDLQKALNLPVNETNKVYFSTAIGDTGISGMSTIKTLHAEMHNYIGLAFYELGKYDSAIYHYTQAVQLKENTMYFNNRALSFETKGENNLAVKDYEKALSLNENDQVAQFNLIQLYGKMGYYKKQESLLDKVSEHTTLPEIYVYKGTNYYQTDNFLKAVAQYDSAILLNSENEDYYLYRGQTYEQLKDYYKARQDYEKAIELKKNYSNAYFGLGNICFKTHEPDSALMFYDLAILYNPKYAKAYLNRGIVYLQKKDLSQACYNIGVAKKSGLKEAEELYSQKCQDQ